MVKSIQFINFFKKELTFNTVVVGVMMAVIAMYISAVTEKAEGIDHDDNAVDFLKIFIVGLNIFLIGLLLARKRLLTRGSLCTRGVLISALIALTVVILINLSIAVMIHQSEANESDADMDVNKLAEEGEEEENEMPLSWVPYNQDFLTTGVSLGTDILFLYVYSIFKVRSAVMVTVALICVNIIVIGVAFHLDTDIAIDVGNLTLALVTCSLSVFIWTAKIKFTDEGDPDEIIEYGLLVRDMDDLDPPLPISDK